MKPQTRKLIIEGLLIIVLFVLITVSFTVAWFKGDTETNVNEFTIEVKSSDNFQLSLDGVNFQDSITINLDNKETQIDDQTFDTSVQLSDLASILTSVTNDQNTKTYKSLGIYSPTRDEDTGEPITALSNGNTWSEAVSSKVTKSGDNYYLTSSQIGSLAEYLEIDIWVRSDSSLSIYLGEDSTIYPVTEVDENATYTPAMASKTITEYGYRLDNYYDGTAGQNYGSTYTDTNNNVYVFKSVYENDVESKLFLFKTNTQQVENEDTHQMENFTFYYTEDDTYIVRSKNENISLPIYNSNEPLGSCEAYYGASNTVLFYVKLSTDGHYTSKTVYDSQRNVVNVSNYETFFENYGDGFTEYMKMYTFDSFNFSHTYQNRTSKTDTYYYNELGELLIRIHDENDTKTYYNDDNEVINAPDKPYQVLKESYYGTEDQEKVGDVFLTKSTSYAFSKNLVAGATLVSFSEMVTDSFTENNQTIDKEVENLKYLWNPLPEFSLVTQGTTSKYVYDANRDETLSYYTYDSNTNEYTLTNWDSDDSLIKVGNFLTNSTTVGTGENPILETKVNSSDKYAVKKMRIKIWLDGNDSMATNSMLNSSTVGNGQIKMCINLVANINSTSLSYEPYTTEIGGVTTVVPGKFLVTASKANGKTDTYTFSASGTWVNQYGYTLATATLENVNGRTDQKIVSFYKYGSVTVYAKDSNGRVASTTISYDYAKLIKIYDSNYPNSYKVIAVSMYCDKAIEDITIADYITTGTWTINDQNIASTTVNADGSLTVNFSSGGEEIVSYSCVMNETLNNTEYYASNSLLINHSYVNQGGN